MGLTNEVSLKDLTSREWLECWQSDLLEVAKLRGDPDILTYEEALLYQSDNYERAKSSHLSYPGNVKYNARLVLWLAMVIKGQGEQACKEEAEYARKEAKEIGIGLGAVGGSIGALGGAASCIFGGPLGCGAVLLGALVGATTFGGFGVLVGNQHESPATCTSQ